MQNSNSKWNTILLVVLVILAALILWKLYAKDDEMVYTPTPMPEVVDHTQPQQNPTNNQQPSTPTTTWIYTTTPGLVVAYKSNWVAVTQSYGSPAMQAQGQSNIVGYMFTLPSGNTIMWGGNQSTCNATEFGAFVDGTSTVACVKGIRADIGVANVRNTLPQSDKNEFGDFVIKNQ